MSKIPRSYEVVATYRIYEKAAAGSTLAQADKVVQALALRFDRVYHKSAPERLALKFALNDRSKLEDRGIKYYFRGDYVTVTATEYRVYTTFTSRASAQAHANVLTSTRDQAVTTIEVTEMRHFSTWEKA